MPLGSFPEAVPCKLARKYSHFANTVAPPPSERGPTGATLPAASVRQARVAGGLQKAQAKENARAQGSSGLRGACLASSVVMCLEPGVRCRACFLTVSVPTVRLPQVIDFVKFRLLLVSVRWTVSSVSLESAALFGLAKSKFGVASQGKAGPRGVSRGESVRAGPLNRRGGPQPAGRGRSDGTRFARLSQARSD